MPIGWSGIHLNLFHIHGQDYGVYHDGGSSFADNPEQVVLSIFGFRTRERFFYEYDFADETDLEDEWSQEDRPVDPDYFSRREVNARLRQYARGDREWLFSI